MFLRIRAVTGGTSDCCNLKPTGPTRKRNRRVVPEYPGRRELRYLLPDKGTRPGPENAQPIILNFIMQG